MKKTARALVVLAAVGIVPAVVVADEGGIPSWFTRFLASFNAQIGSILTRLGAVETQSAQNATDIANVSTQTQQNTKAIGDLSNAVSGNTADIAKNTLDILHNGDAISKNTSDITALQTLTQVYRFTDYNSPGDTVSVFSSVGGGSCGNSETQTRTKVPQPDGSVQLNVDTVRRLNGVVCQHQVSRFILDGRGQLATGQDTLSNIDPTVILSTTAIEVPIILRPAEMRVGTTWGSASKTTLTNVAGGGVQTVGFATSVSSLTAVDSVTVPAGVFTDCLRAVEIRNSAQIGLFTQYDWFCRGVGLVKRISEQGTALVGFQLELQSISTP